MNRRAIITVALATLATAMATASHAQQRLIAADTLRVAGGFHDPADDDFADFAGADPYDGGEGGGGLQSPSPALALAGDVFSDATGFGLSLFRFRARGLGARHSEKYINGVPFNDLNRGVFNYSSLASLNELTRRTDAARHGDPAPWTLGATGGAENIDMRPGGWPRGMRLSVTAADRDYNVRATAMWSSGMTARGWAFTVGAGGRWGDARLSDIAGIFRRDAALFVGMERRWAGGRHSLSAVAWVAPYERGLQAASVREAYALTGDNLYNPAWGWHDGRRRNSRTARGADPALVISHVWRPSEGTTLATGASLDFQMYSGTGLYRWGGADPRPDHYTRLPSYQTDPAARELVEGLWRGGDPRAVQVDWEAMYTANALSRMTGDGAATYIVERRHSDLLSATLNTTLDTRTGPRGRLTAGVEVRAARSMQYKTVDDLLGGDHIRDTDPYADSPAAAPNDLDRTGRIVRTGGVFGYNYDIDIFAARLWAVSRHEGRVVRSWFGGEAEYTAFVRDGLMRNGRWPDSSAGRGAAHTFTGAGFRAGAVATLGGRNFIAARVYAGTQAPLPSQAYLSPRVTDRAVEGLASAVARTAEIGWMFEGRRVRGRATLFHAAFDGLTERSSYWHDEAGTFVNHVLTGVATRHNGVELAAEWKPGDAWTLTLAGSAGRYVYAGDPDGVITNEDGTGGETRERVLLRGAYLGGTPQAAGVFEVEYFLRYWFFTVRGAAAALNHVSIAPSRRLASLYAVAPTHPGLSGGDPVDAAALRTLTAQERLPAAATLDVSVGKLLYLPGGRRMTFNLSVVNLLDNRDIVTGGYESGRADIDNPTRHATRYYYARGRHFYISVGARF
jgi:hypothetical protein